MNFLDWKAHCTHVHMITKLHACKLTVFVNCSESIMDQIIVGVNTEVIASYVAT